MSITRMTIMKCTKKKKLCEKHLSENLLEMCTTSNLPKTLESVEKPE